MLSHQRQRTNNTYVKRDRFAGSKRVYELLDKPDKTLIWFKLQTFHTLQVNSDHIIY